MSIMDANASQVRQVNINEEMREAYLDYAMSVIVARALPDARDGLKPVHRRILYAMYNMGLRSDTPYRKSARIVGEVLGKYHPHGDASVYDAMVRMAQDFSMRIMLVDGQGNFGSIDGDAAAAMRYTEARMASFGEQLLADINKETVDFVENFDGSLTEPSVMPAAVPNLLVNGSSGIAVGMSTNIPPHNLGEVCDAVTYLLEQWERLDDIGIAELMQFIKGPDFPTGGLVFTGEGDDNGLISAYATGRGKIIMRARAHIEDLGRGRSRIIITEIPFQINKSSLIERIVDIAQDGKIEGLVDLRDESDRQGLRLVVEIGRTADPVEVLNLLFKYTPLQSTFGIIMLALLEGEPRTLNLKQLLRAFIEHRLEVIRRRSEYDLQRAKDRAHILEGLLKAINDIDRAIAIIRNSEDTEAARANLIAAFDLSEIQANAILDMQLRRLAALERQKLEDELAEKYALIRDLTALLESPSLMRQEVARETQEVRKQYAEQRRTVISHTAPTAVTEGNLMGTQANTWVTLTVKGNLSIPHDDQPPKITASLKEAPYRILESNPSDTLYLITDKGQCATLLTSQIPKANSMEEGVPFWQLCDLRAEDTLAHIINLPNQLENGYLFLVSYGGEVKRLKIDDLPSMRASSFKLFDTEGDDRLQFAFWVQDEDQVMLISRLGQAIRFNAAEVRPSGLTAGGVRGMKLDEKNDGIVGAGVVGPKNFVWVVTESGVGKRSPIDEYPTQGRAGGGVRTLKFPPGNNQFLAAGLIGRDKAELIALTNKRTAKRSRIASAEVLKRDYKGTPELVSLAKGESVAEVYLIAPRAESESS